MSPGRSGDEGQRHSSPKTGVGGTRKQGRRSQLCGLRRTLSQGQGVSFGGGTRWFLSTVVEYRAEMCTVLTWGFKLHVPGPQTSKATLALTVTHRKDRFQVDVQGSTAPIRTMSLEVTNSPRKAGKPLCHPAASPGVMVRWSEAAQGTSLLSPCTLELILFLVPERSHNTNHPPGPK